MGWVGKDFLVVGRSGGIARMGEIPGLNSKCYHFGQLDPPSIMLAFMMCFNIKM